MFNGILYRTVQLLNKFIRVIREDMKKLTKSV